MAGNKSTVTFINTSPEVKKTLVNLSKTALRASAKVIRKKLRADLPTRSNRLKNHIGSWAMINYQTGQPTLQIGFYGWQRVKKKGKLPSHANPHWVELGTSKKKKKRKARKPIQPKNAKVLAYNDVIYGRSVQHPGTAGTHILRNTVQNNIAEIRAAQAEYLAELSKKIEEAKGKCYTGEDTDEDD